ncbi:MAG: hypothetical protein ACREEM_06940 [Blastocatellia bacterium]
MRIKSVLWLCLVVTFLTLSPQIQAQSPAKEQASVTSTERIEFGMRGLIQVVESFGEVRIEGWDKPEVELTVNKSTQKQYLPKDLAKGMKELERVKVTMERVGESSMLVIHTTFPSRTPARLMRGKTNLQLEYTIRIPRTSRLMVKHDIGEVVIANVDGDIEATNRIGELRLDLPEANQYAVDARVKIGDVSSEFGPETERQKLLGAKLAGDPPSSTRRLYLRVGIGEIDIKKLKTEPAAKPEQRDGANRRQ